MKSILAITLLFLSSTIFSQEKTNNIYEPLPNKEIQVLLNSCSGVEITFYENSSSVSMTGNTNTKFIPTGIDTIAPTKLNKSNHAYMMIMVNDDFYMDAELSLGESNYLIFKKDGVKYYSLLNEKGTYFFKQLMK